VAAPPNNGGGNVSRASELRILYPKYPTAAGGPALALRQLRVSPEDVPATRAAANAGSADARASAVVGTPRRKAPPAELDVLTSDVLRGRRTIQEIVAEALRDAIVTGRLKGGERLHQDGIASRLGVSRMPVREALRQLESEGLVVFTPHRRVSVAALSAEELREIYQIRTALELLALDLAVPRMSAQDLAALGELLEQMDRVTDPGRWLELNRGFHRTLYRASGRARLCALIDSLRGNVERYLRIYVSGREHRARAQAEHRRIVRACRRRQAAEAKKALRRHLLGTVDQLEGFLLRSGRERRRVGGAVW
jgi:DNA-binding GntR family transcriptional regulator